MTSENVIRAGLEDVRAIRVQCADCKASVTFSPDSWEKIPYSCANCGKQWIVNNSADAKHMEALQRLFTQFRGTNERNFSVQFELLPK